MSQHRAEMLHRKIDVTLTRRAEQALSQREDPLCLEMELYFSCLVRKRVLVTDVCRSDYRSMVNDKLSLGFRPVMTSRCSLDDTGDDGRPPLTDFPIVKPERYIPHWLRVDFVRGEWRAEFGYHDS